MINRLNTVLMIASVQSAPWRLLRNRSARIGLFIVATILVWIY